MMLLMSNQMSSEHSAHQSNGETMAAKVTPSQFQFVPDQDKWDLRSIPLAEIREASDKLRDVDRGSSEWIQLKDSVKKAGILMPILVREIHDQTTGKTLFQLVDGLQRFTAMSELGATHIPANVVDFDNAEVFEAQLIANAKKVETKPNEFAKHIIHILDSNPLLTKEQLATRLNSSVGWIDKILGLKKLNQDLAPMVDEGKITAVNAINLAKLPPEDQIDMSDLAQTMGNVEFFERVKQRQSEISALARKGRDAGPAEWQPTPVLRRPSEVKKEYEKPMIASEVLAATGAKTPADGFRAGILWVLKMDPISIDQQRAQEEQRKERTKAEAARKKKEREDFQAELASRRQAALKSEEQPAEAIA
jgi:ParB/RepB/Spo0J family partition protein